MGVPKFFRWLSERYPTISQLIAENRIPEFDCLYLDMNGIIHNCTHGDSDSPTFRMTEDVMFIAIFNYIEHLFGKIKPRKLFFMAIDGVAPRAKMNQQRARRFRTALDADNAKQKAIREGVEMPKEAAFDSNCITPGTEFMAKLTAHLKYFINKKVSEDVDWQGVEVVLSGHEVPGEGEHKIMEYIRLAKAQPSYDPNVRHCLYGLDADLIMLGLLSHDPHFCLLREEVTFGRQSRAKSKELEHQNFYLMHLSVVREYLEHEFQELSEPGVLSFPFDMERIIDDFILLAFFVGNDFLPNLPGLHINEGALSLQFKVYKKILPGAKGYINEHGVINLERLLLLLEALSEFEEQLYESESSAANWLKGKQRGALEALEKAKGKGRIVLTTEQKRMFTEVKKWLEDRRHRKGPKVFDVPADYPAKDRRFVEELAASLRLNCQRLENEQGELYLALSHYGNNNSDDEEEQDSEEDEEGQAAVLRVLGQYNKAEVVDVSVDEAKAELERKYKQGFYEWKDEYYKGKLGFGLENEEEMKHLTENYVEGLQWVLYYYYRGVASWPWYYRYHYSPRISDVHKGLKANLNFKLGKPFKPFEQLMGVLPDRSKTIVPGAYHDLMTDPGSPIIDFYPRDFELDMNGKKMEWEAVVKIPFIEEDRLLAAMRTKEHLLSPEERSRNDFGVTLKFTYNPNIDEMYPSSMPGVFPELARCHCVANVFELPTLEGLEIIVGLCEGAKLGIHALAGFPSLKTLSHTAELGYHGVNVFQQDSRNESMILMLGNAYQDGGVEEAKNKIGQRVFVGYPFLQEGRVSAVSDELFRYHRIENGQVIPVPHSPIELGTWRRKAERMENTYSKKMGIVIGAVEVILHVDILKGLKRTDEGAMVKEYAQVPGIETDYAAQTVVEEVASEDQRFLEKSAIPIAEEFPEGSRAFFLGEFNYGRPLEVVRHDTDRVDIWIATMKAKEPDFGRDIVIRAEQSTRYTPSYAVARILKLNPLVLSRITSSFTVVVDDNRLNLGLNLKFEAKKLKVLGYSRRGDNGWEFSQKAVDLVQEYIAKFPQFFQGIQRNPQGDLYSDTDFFDPSESKAKIKEIQDWLKSVQSRSFEKVPLEAQQLDGGAVGEIEAAANQYMQELEGSKPRRIRSVPRKALLKPSDAEHRLHNQWFSLGDRVVYVQDSGKVPIATRGTVVGLTRTTRQTLLDVVFDLAFMSGTTLSDRCSPFRGMTVPVSSVLNLTNRQLIVESKASELAKPPPTNATPNWHTSTSTPPQLTGGFSLAVMGSGRGGRGGRDGAHSPRGGGRGRNRGGIGSNGHNHSPPSGPRNSSRPNGYPSFRGGGGSGRTAHLLVHGGPPAILQRPQVSGDGYRAVPPPANLNSPRRGRGRMGGGRERGGGGGGNGSGVRGKRGGTHNAQD
ncbi:XRN 5'-3' exonuclease N-terminus-domain-containing protein [Tuber indicum]|nr:XRN 5'-3' exonuclease N-terminus-domain-containing protein [Tuber indicum]